MAGIYLSLLGGIIGIVGLVIRVAPGLDRPKRRFLYKWLPITRGLFFLRESTEKGDTPDYVEDKWVIRVFLDWVDAELPNDLPDRKVVAVTPFAASMRVHFPDGDSDSYPLGRPSHSMFQSFVSDAIRSKCKSWGLGVAIVGFVVLAIGILLG